MRYTTEKQCQEEAQKVHRNYLTINYIKYLKMNSKVILKGSISNVHFKIFILSKNTNSTITDVTLTGASLVTVTCFNQPNQ